jgi:hypothetical protein
MKIDTKVGRLRDLRRLGTPTAIDCECGNTSGQLIDDRLVLCLHCNTLYLRDE